MARYHVETGRYPPQPAFVFQHVRTPPQAFHGQLVGETDSIADAIALASAHSSHGYPDSGIWIYDQEEHRLVTRAEILSTGSRCSPRYPA